MTNLRSRIDRLEPKLVPSLAWDGAIRVISYANDPTTWNRAEEAYQAAKAEGREVLVIDRRIVSPGDPL